MSGEQARVSIVIPHYNQKECLERLLPTIVDQAFRDFEVIIVDDCTPDEQTISFIENFIKDKPYMRLVRNTLSLRLAGTLNKGIKLAKAEYICLLRSDTELKSDFIQRYVEVMDSDSTLGGLSCIIVDQYERIQFSGGYCTKGLPSTTQDSLQEMRQADYLEGIATFYRRDVFDQVGLFDENNVLYYEDVDFGQRVNAKTSYRLCIFPDKLVTYYVGPDLPRHGYYSSRSVMLLTMRYARADVFNTIKFIVYIYIVRNLTNAVLNAVAGLRGAIDGLLGRTARWYK